MRAAGYAVQIITEKISKETLGPDVAAVYLPGPMVPLTDAERTALDDFVRRGGTMIMTVHVPFPIMGTPARYGLPVGTGVMVVPGATPDPGVWATSEIKKDPVTRGVKTLSVVSGWPVSVSPSEIADPRIVIEAPKNVVVDGNGDNAFDASDPQPPYGVVGVATIGSGRVVVLGDDGDLREHRHRHERQREVPRQPPRAHLIATTRLSSVSRGARRERTHLRKVGGKHGHS